MTVKQKSFFLGELYPFLSFLLIVFGYFSGLEVFTILINIILVSVAILKTGTLKPFLFFVLTFMYQINPEHMPIKPHNSDYYFTGYRTYILGLSFLMLLVSVITFVVKYRVFDGVKWNKIPLFIPLVIFSLAMLLNGAFVRGNDVMNAVWGIGQVFVYLVLYLLFYLGMKKENKDQLLDYFFTVTMLMSWVLILEVLDLYIFGNVLVGGEVDRSAIVLGFGNCNIVGAHAAMLIPVNFHAFLKEKRRWLSLFTALMMYVLSIASSSRNALLFGTVYLVVCFVIAFISSGRKKEMLSIFIGVCSFALVLGIIFREEITTLLEHYISRGLGDSGRFEIWKKSCEIFLEYPIFGKGFYDLGLLPPNSFDSLSFTLVPDFAHNTFFELIAATGLVGLISYVIYRISTVALMLYRASFDRIMLMLGASAIVAMSLLDNYVFQIFSPAYYTAAVAVAAIFFDGEMSFWNETKQPLKIKLLRLNFENTAN